MTDTSDPILFEINDAKLTRHLRLCTRNLKSDRVKCCAECPFEAIIVRAKPDLAALFARKRERICDVMAEGGVRPASPGCGCS